MKHVLLRAHPPAPAGFATTIEFLGPLAVVLVRPHRRRMLPGAPSPLRLALLTWFRGDVDLLSAWCSLAPPRPAARCSSSAARR